MGVSVIGLHPGFTVMRKGEEWAWNRARGPSDVGTNIKLLFAFREARELDELVLSGLHAKIGPNRDRSLPYCYAGIAYAKDSERGAIEAQGHRFTYATLIIGLIGMARCYRLPNTFASNKNAPEQSGVLLFTARNRNAARACGASWGIRLERAVHG